MLFRSNCDQRTDHRRLNLVPGAFFLMMGVIFLSGCALVAKPSLTPTLTANPSAAIVATHPVPAVTNAAPLPSPTVISADPTHPFTLTLWLPSEMVLAQEDITQTARYVGALNRDFSATHPGLSVTVAPKAPYGLGGLTHMLTTTQAVKPFRMPDIVAVDTSDLPELVQEGILVPLDSLIPEYIWEELFPFAEQAATVDGVRYAVPFQADILFLAYNTSLVSEPPLTWQGLPGIKAGYIFPMARGDGSAADQFLLQYLAQDGELEGQSYHLDAEIVAGVLQNYHRAIEWGAIPEAVRGLGTLDDCWAIYLAGNVGMTNVDSRQYQRDREKLKRTRYSHIPTVSGKSITLAHSWGWAIVTTDPMRQELAAEYVIAAVQKDHLASWATEAAHLPTYPGVLESVIEDKDYRDFLEEQLQHAYPYPSAKGYPRVQEAIIRAIEDVLDGVSTPERAAAAAAARVARIE